METIDLLSFRLSKLFDDELRRLGVEDDDKRIILLCHETDDHVAYVRYSIPVARLNHDVLRAAFEDDRWEDIDDAVKAVAAFVAEEVQRIPKIVE